MHRTIDSYPRSREEEPRVGAPGELDNALRGYIEYFDFHRSPELHEASLAIIDGLMNEGLDKERLQLAWSEFAKIAERIVESAETAAGDTGAYVKAQIEAILYKALLFQTAGKIERYLEELDQTQVLALNAGHDSLSAEIDREIEAWIDTVELSPEILIVKLRGRIADENREFLRDLLEQGADLEDMVTHAYNALLEEGEDPDEVLAELGVLG